jgi:DNA-binding beta-propeller fold protein YncE
MTLSNLRNSAFVRPIASVTLLAAVAAFSLRAQVPQPRVSLINRDAVYSRPLAGHPSMPPTAPSPSSRLRAATSVTVGDGPVSIGANNRTGDLCGPTPASTPSPSSGKTDKVIAIFYSALPAVAVDENNKVYVSNIFNNMVTVIDGAQLRVQRPAGSADGIIVDNDRRRVYLLHYENTIVTEFDPPPVPPPKSPPAPCGGVPPRR